MTLIHIYTSTVVVDIVSYVIENKKKGMLDALCAHSQKIHHQHLQVLLIYFNYHSIRDYSSIHVFSFCFFFLNLRRRCVAYLPSFISDSTSPPAREEYITLI